MKYKKENDPRQNIALLDLGKLPPQAVDLECSLLGAIMIDSQCLEQIYNELSPVMFYKDNHQKIYQTIVLLYDSNAPIDILTVTEQLRRDEFLDEVGGPLYITQLTSNVANSAHVPFWTKIIKDKYFMREMINITVNVQNSCFDEKNDTADIIELWQSTFEKKVQDYLGMQRKKTLKELLNQSLKEYDIREALAKENKLAGIPMPLAELTVLMNGWQKGDLTIIAARPAMGKCLGENTLVLMFDGTLRKVQDIVTGDLLMGPDSKPREVLSTTFGYENMYNVHQKHGITYRVNESHILSLKRSRNENKYKKGEILNISVRDWLNSSKKFKSNYKGWKTEVEFEAKDLLLEPYFLGIWLSDGKNEDQRIYKPDIEIKQYMQSYAENFDDVTFKDDSEITKKCPCMTISGTKGKKNYLMESLRKYDLINNKHIPNDFLVNSKENRLQLLAGLLDGDGNLHNGLNTFEITQKNENLIKQIKFLADSLGFMTTLKPKKGKIKSTGFEGDYFRLNISGNTDIIPTKVKRKQATPRKQIKDWRVGGIDVKFDGLGKYYGFELSGDGLFLLEDFTVTHNTALLLAFLKTCAKHFFNAAVFSLEMPGVRLVDRLLCGEAEINPQKFKKGLLNEYEKQKLKKAKDDLYELGIDIDDNANVTMDYVKNMCRIMKSKGQLDILFIDYLQLILSKREKNRNREQEVSEISRTAKLLAKELDIPVIILAQLNRDVERRGGTKRPQLSDLRESGSIEQDADNVILIYRAEYYKFDEYEDGTPSKGVGELMIEKQRNGSTGVVKFGHDEALTRVFDYIDPNNIPLSVTGSIDDELLPPMDLSSSEKMF